MPGPVLAATTTFECEEAIPFARCVELASDGRVNLCELDDTTCIGVSVEDRSTLPSAGPAALAVCTSGIVWVTSDGSAAINIGDYVKPAAAGKVRPQAIASGTTLRQIIGRAITSAAASDGTMLLITLDLVPRHMN